MISLNTHGYILCFSSSEVLSISKKFATTLHTRFSTPSCVFHADFACEFINHLLRGFLAEQDALSQFSCHGPDAQNCLLSIVTFLRQLVHWRSTHLFHLTFGLRLFLHPPTWSTVILPCFAGWYSSRVSFWSFSWLLGASFVLLRLIRSSCPSNWLLSILNVSS